MRTAALLTTLLLGLPQLVAADAPEPSKWRFRSGASAALMVSNDQLSWLQYDRPGFLGDLQLGYGVLPWLDIQVGTTFGVFLSPQDNGGLAAPTLGALARWHLRSIRPYAFADLAGAFTGPLFLPMWRAGVGLELPLTRNVSIGPMLSFNDVMFADDPGNSTDAVFLTFGLACLYAPVPAPPPPQRRAAVAPPPPPPRVVEVREPTADLMQLVDNAVPGRTDQVELLAPVLFAFDSDELEPIGVAMLHEVSRELGKRTDLELIEIRAYADARGSSDYNRELAERRGKRVFDWLVEHGVAPERLSIAPVGAVEFVEAGGEESAHEQNRRVVFRVLKIAEKTE